MTQAIASMVTALGVVFAGISIRAGLVQRHRQFEALYINRYWSLLDRLSSEAVITKQRPISPDDRLAIRLYFQLCQDEIEMYQRGWITERTFEEWRQGMAAALKAEPFASEWSKYDKELRSETSTKKPLDDLRRLIVGQEPCRDIGRLTAKIRGV